jgi:hypothetical protein
VSKARSVAVLAGAVALCATVRAADVHEADLEGYVTPPGAASRVEPRSPELPTAAPSAGRVAAASDSLPDSLALVWLDTGSAASGSERSARDEAVRLLRAMGVRASWRTAEPGDDPRPGELRVILLDRAAVDRTGAPVLGSTPSHFEGEPFFWVHVPSVRGAVGLDPRRPLSPADLRERHLLGVALGRVIAHETVHAIAPDVPHSAGLMAPLLKKNDLTSRKVAVPAELGRAFRAALAGGRPAAAPAPAEGTRLLTLGAERADGPR